MKVKIVYEDEEMMVVNKPAGMVVNRAVTVKGETLQDWVMENCVFNLANSREYRNGIVHRIDKDTSGVLLIAKTQGVFKELTSQFASRTVRKTYKGLVHGVVKPNEGVVFLPLARSRSNRERFSISATGKKAETRWKVEKIYKEVNKEGVSSRGYQGFSLLSLFPKTGRTHQIRVHLSHLGFPIVGDGRYTGKKRAREDQKWCKRQFLHAYEVNVFHPKLKKRISFRADLASDLSEALSCLS